MHAGLVWNDTLQLFSQKAPSNVMVHAGLVWNGNMQLFFPEGPKQRYDACRPCVEW